MDDDDAEHLWLHVLLFVISVLILLFVLAQEINCPTKNKNNNNKVPLSRHRMVSIIACLMFFTFTLWLTIYHLTYPSINKSLFIRCGSIFFNLYRCSFIPTGYFAVIHSIDFGYNLIINQPGPQWAKKFWFLCATSLTIVTVLSICLEIVSNNDELNGFVFNMIGSGFAFTIIVGSCVVTYILIRLLRALKYRLMILESPMDVSGGSQVEDSRNSGTGGSRTSRAASDATRTKTARNLRKAKTLITVLLAIGFALICFFFIIASDALVETVVRSNWNFWVSDYFFLLEQDSNDGVLYYASVMIVCVLINIGLLLMDYRVHKPHSNSSNSNLNTKKTTKVKCLAFKCCQKVPNAIQHAKSYDTNGANGANSKHVVVPSDTMLETAPTLTFSTQVGSLPAARTFRSVTEASDRHLYDDNTDNNHTIRSVNSMNSLINMIPSIGTKSGHEWRVRENYLVQNPLVVMFGIGEYDNGKNLVGMSMDYKNMIALWNLYFGYAMFYRDENNKNRYYEAKVATKRNLYDKFKLRWVYEEIDEFMKDVVNIVTDESKGHDAMIFVISSHGNYEQCLIDSESDEYQLIAIFNRFNGANCPYLANKPKLFFIDACRGGMKSRPISRETTFMSSGKSENNVGNVGNGSDASNANTVRSLNSVRTVGDTDNLTVRSMDGSNGGDNGSNNEMIGRYGAAAGAAARDRKVSAYEYIHKEANFRFIYGNPDGYAVFDGGKHGGYLIQAMKKVFMNKKALTSNLTEIVGNIRSQVYSKTGKQSMQNVQDVINTNFEIQFAKRK